MVGAGLAVAEAPDAGPDGARDALSHAKGEAMLDGGTADSTGSIPTQFVRLLDLSDPANPRTLQTFDAVSSTLLDDSRSLIYITNDAGLWVLSHNVSPPHPLCDSEITDAANCYAY